MKTCPYCAEKIQDSVIKCRFCGEMLDGSRTTTPSGYPAHQAHDFLTFLQEHARLSFVEAVAELRRRTGTQPALAEPVSIPKKEELFPYDLMKRVSEIWHQAFCEQPEALEYLESRGIHDKGLLRDMRVGSPTPKNAGSCLLPSSAHN